MTQSSAHKEKLGKFLDIQWQQRYYGEMEATANSEIDFGFIDFSVLRYG